MKAHHYLYSACLVWMTLFFTIKAPWLLLLLACLALGIGCLVHLATREQDKQYRLYPNDGVEPTSTTDPDATQMIPRVLPSGPVPRQPGR